MSEQIDAVFACTDRIFNVCVNWLQFDNVCGRCTFEETVMNMHFAACLTKYEVFYYGFVQIYWVLLMLFMCVR